MLKNGHQGLRYILCRVLFEKGGKMKKWISCFKWRLLLLFIIEFLFDFIINSLYIYRFNETLFKVLIHVNT